MSAINSNGSGTYFTGIHKPNLDGVKFVPTPGLKFDYDVMGTGKYLGVPRQEHNHDGGGVCTAPPVDTAKVSTSAGAEKTNPFQGASESSTEVSVDKWGKGKNDSVESILRNQGYSLKEIYTKDAGGQTLIDRVASVNGLKNPNFIKPGQQLQVPAKANSTSVSTRDVAPGHSETAAIFNDRTGIQSTASVNRNGTNRTTTSTLNEERGARTGSTSTIGAGGRIDTSISGNANGTAAHSQSTVLSRDGSSRTTVDTRATADRTTIDIRDIDKTQGMDVRAGQNGVDVTNRGSSNGNTGRVHIGTNERANEGFFERTFGGVGRTLGHQDQAPTTGSVQGATDVRHERGPDGSTITTAVVDGKRVTVGQTAGSSDDGFLERMGAGADRAVGWLGSLVGA